tara:strand:- start:7014 stop:7178 length:165 start_codon:yes stop_codon:yes gene_type:complete
METWEKVRIIEYGDYGKQLDLIWHAIDADEDLKVKFADFYNHVKAVKDANPKSE